MLTLSRLLWAATSAALFVALPACVAPGADSGPPPQAIAREGAASGAGLAPETPIRMVTLVDDLDKPWGMDFLPDGSLLVTEKSGVLKRIDLESYAVTAIGGLPASADVGQGGLMDVLVHPDFASNGWVYLSYSVAEGGAFSTRVSRGRLADGALVDVEELFTAQPFFRERRHFGSRLLLDGGYLYVTVGDRGNRDLAQSLETHNGKVLRLTEDGALPPDNPFVGVPGARPEIWTYGHRNPQGMARHPVTGAIWVAEHGPQGGDELNVLRRGANYGWPLVTYGEEYGGGRIGEGTHRAGTEQPLVYWVPSIGTGNIAFYDGDLYPGWRPSVLVSGLKLTRISRLELDGDGVGAETRLLANLKMRIRDVRTGPDGRVYALAAGSRLIRLEVAEPAPTQ
ncbi:PQQ-dependent sugar dehydrogenase [Parahaliea mediterranea]|uniref:PQQ-dependent sugar dehydrogenase n=1 Tax=Parahaliea mediterranea TaxID=651086 RepID=A0A939DIV7_9GAMM|nr:PQQ-dependent sugar dehydrogenase [Parahaliea mediterranea]MBN7799073.1 PQQ-dependent sugar dehydrogenase [Parahaliea mediterranea]